jgi:hypothetical protein
MTTATRFASTVDYDKGGVEIIGDEQPKRYLFSNLFEVADKSAPWERVVVARNLEFTIECARAEGDSPWYVCAHDETALSMQGAMEIRFVEPADDTLVPGDDHPGAVRLEAEPAGRAMGWVRLGRGHQALLPAGAAYQFRPQDVGVVLLQSILGDESIERWSDICQH